MSDPMNIIIGIADTAYPHSKLVSPFFYFYKIYPKFKIVYTVITDIFVALGGAPFMIIS